MVENVVCCLWGDLGWEFLILTGIGGIGLVFRELMNDSFLYN